MSRTVRLDTLIADVQFKADVGGATVRHTAAQITRLINQSIQMFRERISDEGSTHYLEPYSGTLGIGPTSPYAFYQLDLSSGPSPALVRTYGVDVTIDGVVHKLDHVPFESRNDYGTIAGGSRPVAWCHFKTAQVGILPASSAAYPFTVWYLPKLADLAADSDTFDGVAGWEEWVVWDVVCQIIARDQFPQAFAIAEQRRAEVEQRVIRGATKVSQAGGAHVGRDSFGGKLTPFLGGRRQTAAVSGGPVVPGSGSVTDAMLADMTGPAVKGVLSGTTRPYSIGVATLTTYLSQFSTLQRGLVPPPLAVSQLFLRDDGTWASAGGAGGGGSVGPSGAIQFQAGTGMAGASGFRVHGNSPSLLIRLDGSMRITGGSLDVGSGTTKVTATGIDAGGGAIVNVGTLVAAALSAPVFTDTTAGLAPLSGGGTTNFLRADGSWSAAGGGSPGGGSGAIQYNDGSALTGSTGLSIQNLPGGFAPRPAIAFGNPNATVNFTTGDIRTASGFVLVGATPSGGRAFPFSWTAPATVATGGSVLFGSTDLSGNNAIRGVSHELATGGSIAWRFGVDSNTIGSIRATGANFANQHVHAKSLTLAEGVATLTTSLTEFTDTDRGVVPLSGGGTTNYLRADGTWAAPPGGSASSPGGDTGFVQYRDAVGGFAGASGVTVVASGQALLLGHASGAPSIGDIRLGGYAQRSIVGVSANNENQTLWLYAPSGLTATPGSPTLGVITYGRGSGTIQQHRFQTAPSGSIDFELGASGPNSIRFMPTGVDFDKFHVRTRSLTTPGDALLGTLNLTGSGLSDANLAPMGSGTVKGRLSGTGTPSDISIPTLHAFAPTFTAVKPGTVPQSGGGTANFLRADGSWAVPPGGAASAPSGPDFSVQFNNSGAFEGATGIKVSASGSSLVLENTTITASGVNAQTIRLGNSPTLPTAGHIRGPAGFSIFALTPSLSSQRVMDYGNATGTLQFGEGAGFASGIVRYRFDVLSPQTEGTPGAGFQWRFNVATATTAQLSPTGFDLTRFHVAARSLSLATGIADDQLQPMGSGTVKGRLSGTGTPSDISIPTLHAFAPTFTATKPGTVPESGGGTSNYLRADGSWAAPSGAHQFPNSGGVTNLQMAQMPTGTVKANLSGDAVPSDLPIATLLAFAPTFTATKLGVVPASGGGTTNFLRADGTWTTPAGAPATPGGGPNAIQFNDNGVTNGASGYGFSSAGGALGIGVPSFLPGFGDIRVASGLNITANLPSGVGGVAATQRLLDWSGGGASGTLRVGGASGIMGTHRSEVATGGAFEWLVAGQTGMSFRATGLDLTNRHIKAKSIDVETVNGLPFTWNNVKRGADLTGANGSSSGIPSGIQLFTPRGSATGANRYIVPSGALHVPSGARPFHVVLNPTGARGGQVIRVERVDSTGVPLEVRTPTGTVLLSMPSGTKYWGDFMLTKPSGAVFELAGHADMY